MPARNGEYQVCGGINGLCYNHLKIFTHRTQNLYTPLSQNMTDSDDNGATNSSEEEIHSATNVRHHSHRRQPHHNRNAPNANHTIVGRSGNASAMMMPTSFASTSASQHHRRIISPIGGDIMLPGESAAVAHHRHILETLASASQHDAEMLAHHQSNGNGNGSLRRSQQQHFYNNRLLMDNDNDYADDSVAILGARRSSTALAATGMAGDDGSIGGVQQRPPMGPIRRCLFVASLLLCVVTVVLFVWVVPCSEGGATCPARDGGGGGRGRRTTQNWVRHYEGLELKGAINVVRGVRGRSQNLVFMYRGERLLMAGGAGGGGGGDHPTTMRRKRNGIISLVGSSGVVNWFDDIVNEPVAIDCGLIDADRNGVKDCLVLDEFGELGCIDPVSGIWLWHIVAHTVSSARLLSFPLVLPDVTGDGVAELLVTTSTDAPPTANSSYNGLIIVSGASGARVGATYVVPECRVVHKFQLDEADGSEGAVKRVAFNCIRENGTEIQIVETLSTLHRLITNRSEAAADKRLKQPTSMKGAKTKAWTVPIVQHKFYGQRRDTLTQRNIYAVGGKQLIVENAGRCPEACNVSVQLVEQRDGREHVIRNFSGSRMYGMVPALLSFNSSAELGHRKADAQQAVHGFVIKFWQWAENETGVQMQYGRPTGGGGRTKRTKRASAASSSWDFGNDSDGEFNRFAHLMQQRNRRWRYPEVMDAVPVRLRRSTTDSATRGNKSDDRTTSRPHEAPTFDDGVVRSRMRIIRERVVLIVFNSTDTRIENTSQSNIVQFCRRADPDADDAVAFTATAATDDEVPISTSATLDGSAATLTVSPTSATSASTASCQPDLNYQENSVLIADLDEDGSQELVTYYTTYVNAAGDSEARMDWKLVNYVQLLRLEAELPKLYVIDDGGAGPMTDSSGI